LHRELRFQDFEELTIPLYITATNFMDGSQKIFSSGDIADAVIAACSIPIIFPPVMIDNIPYVDGGLSNNLPTEPFTNSKKDIICVYVNPIRPFNPKEGVMEIMDRSIHLSFRGMVSRSASGCGVYIEPPLLSNYGMFDIHKMDEIIGVGYAYAKDYIKTVNME
jgi:NTE family protein